MENHPGKLLRDVRQRHSLTQVQLADLLKATSNYVAQVERAERTPSDQFMAHVELLDWTLTVISEIKKGAIIDSPSKLPAPPLGDARPALRQDVLTQTYTIRADSFY